MSLHERSHASYLPSAEGKADLAVERQLTENDNDRPRTAFEATVEQIRREYTEKEAKQTEVTKQAAVLENDLKQLWQEIEALGLATRGSAPLLAEYAEIQAEHASLIKTAEDLSSEMDRLRLQYEPFQALQESVVTIQASNEEAWRLRGEEQSLHIEAERLRQEWSSHEAMAAQQSEQLDRDEEFVAATQRALVAELEQIKSQRDGYALHRGAAEDPRFAHIPEYQQWARYFKQADVWVASKEQVLQDLVSQREKIQQGRRGLKAAGKVILAKYDTCMEKQVQVAERLAELDQAQAAAQTRYETGRAGVGEVMQQRGVFQSGDQPAWIHRAPTETSSPDSFQQAA